MPTLSDQAAPSAASPAQPAHPRRPYQPPRLITHGTVAELTANSGGNGPAPSGIDFADGG